MKTYFVRLFERIVFLGFTFGLLWVLFILADRGSGSSLLGSAKYYFWMVLPLVVFGIIYHAAELLFKRGGNEAAE
ncbi:hypothetical protein SD70_13305 [Gordoniibacillus kamchatkensis]|uniref:Uncharacterized protein n=1 Tax=Gordoniibacillus kamchatkensis TaxID=1590651 RepID=A0ABR5AJJ4_9BACL|nr:hypothetical protein [Paenibacillus sp. VKM B-2647]KIL40527.1 hypothetical protein SD70_13305 [Paenibacillus sp. VKM B-2647]